MRKAKFCKQCFVSAYESEAEADSKNLTNHKAGERAAASDSDNLVFATSEAERKRRSRKRSRKKWKRSDSSDSDSVTLMTPLTTPTPTPSQENTIRINGGSRVEFKENIRAFFRQGESKVSVIKRYLF